MPRAAVTKAAITRAVKAVEDAGLRVGMVEVGRDGTIRILPAALDQSTVPPVQREENTCAGKFGRRP
jgi:Tfp pilus assembly PilM family ATPase